MSETYDRVEVTSTAKLRDWLAAHHDASPGCWLVTWKKGRGPYVSHAEIVRELLCFGWIDTRGQRVDDDRTSLLVCPRRPGSGWSRVNKGHLDVLFAEGRMQPAGVAVVERAKGDGSWTRLDEVETLREPDDLRKALDAAPVAREHWDAFPPSARRAILEWISSAKRQPTRARRVAETTSEAAAGRRANQPRQPGR
ncbi:MAG: YdeI/OmpD-associated family protein [Nocardioidaceae bacterium]|nr:YdeI/OmpD-associated family protein [Nocardioidaceae bacterium]